jgi:hypothetical protein
MITAILPVFVGDGPPADVDAAYGLVCGVLLGLVAGRIAQLFLWPRTSSQTFLERAAAQLDLCLRALRGGELGADRAARIRGAADLVSAYAKQLALLGQLHAQAHAEPVERALDDGRRAELLALTQDLFDAAQGRQGSSAAAQQVPQENAAALAPLLEALRRQDAALVASVQCATRALRGAVIEPDPALREAHSEVEACLDALRDRPDLARAAGASRSDAFLAALAEQRALSANHLAIETWLVAWRRAEATAVV